MLNNPTVSVCMITYLHENFIEQAINGVLMQKGNFEIELIIANDNSPDETNIIVQNCIVNHPNGSWIKYTHHKTNLGMMPNFVWALQQCKGKYIAICEGDDFWTDSFKLQKQIDVLVNYPNLAGCFHNSEERFWCDYSKASTLFLENKVGREFSFSEMAYCNITPTASVVFKAPIQKEVLTNIYKELKVGDWPLHLLNLRNGNYFYIPQVMSVRYLHTSSTWGMKDQIRNVEIVLNTYSELINSNWFNLDEVELLKEGMSKLSNHLSVKVNQKSKIIKIKNKLKIKLVSIFKKL